MPRVLDDLEISFVPDEGSGHSGDSISESAMSKCTEAFQLYSSDPCCEPIQVSL